jgi:hypothetical protein
MEAIDILKSQSQSRVTPPEIYSGQSGTGANFTPKVFSSSRLIVVPADPCGRAV